MLSLPTTVDWRLPGKSASLLLRVCQGSRQPYSLWHPDKQPITVIKAESDALLLCVSSAFMWTNKLEKQHMDGDQKLNIMSLCLYQQWQGVTDLPCLHLQLGHLHYKPHDAGAGETMFPPMFSSGTQAPHLH